LTHLLEISTFVFVQMIKEASNEPECPLNREAVHDGEGGEFDGFLLERFEKVIHLSFRSKISLLFDLSIQD